MVHERDGCGVVSSPHGTHDQAMHSSRRSFLAGSAAAGMFGSFGEHFDGWMLEYDFLSREISDAEVTAWIAELRAKHGVA